jgi:ketosteroid isomerase-like protein
MLNPIKCSGFYQSIFFVLVLSGCSSSSSTQAPGSDSLVLIQQDQAFSQMSSDSGLAKAFLHYATEDVVKLDPGQHPTIGKEQMRKNFDGPPPPIQLTWEPVNAGIAASNDLGYTWGNYQLKGKNRAGRDTVLYGNYMTVWKKQPDGNWKFALDGGNPTPEPGTK